MPQLLLIKDANTPIKKVGDIIGVFEDAHKFSEYEQEIFYPERRHEPTEGASMNLINKVWGSELVITNNKLYCSKILNLKKQFICSYHRHEIKDETFYVLSGVILLRYNGKEIFMEAEDNPVRIRPGEYHSFLGIHHSRILEVSTQDFKEDSYRQDSSRKMSDSDYKVYYKMFRERR